MQLRTDPVTLEVQWSKLISIVDEAEVSLLRTAFSAIVSEAYDFACSLFDGEGRSLVASSRGMPRFVATMPETMRAFLRAYPPDSLQPGDILVTNDPWICAGHLPDFVIASPIFREKRLVGYAVSMAHTTDIGGSLNWQGTREIFEEGLRVPV
ncbi:MAG: hydantoinase B/oxoprolinase family protein, partial [Armatimonadetes bacterium]|nr:hydantoinase B/oxoprolinase family protein [Armatimonadota bacterium]